MKAIILFCSILFCSAVSLAQTNSEFLLPGGYSVHPPLNNVSNIGFHNPSFLSRFSGISAGLSYQYGSRIENVYRGFGGKSFLNGLPYSAALSYQTGDFNIAAAASQRYNMMLESSDGAGGMVMKNPEGSRKPVNYSIESDIHDYSLVSSYSINNFPEGNSLSLGLRLSLGVLNYYGHYDSAIPLPKIKYSITSTAYALGADYKLRFNKGALSIGAYFEKGLDFQGNINIDETGNLHSAVQVDVSTPDALRMDILLDLENVQVMANLSQIFWHPVDKDYTNNLDFGTAVKYKATGMLSIYLGASITDRQYVNHYYSDQPENDALFLTLGADIKLGNYTLGFSVSDSHLTSADSRKQTVGSLTFGCQF